MAKGSDRRARSARLPNLAGERGAVLVQTGIAIIGLVAFSAFVVDYGILWSARRQAQNAADAGAMAGAISMGYVDMDDQALARTSALNTARANAVWGQVPDITDADVTFPPCPPGSPGAGTNACIRVDVFRNQRAGGNPLPTIFANLVGITNQGVRATATAQVMFGNSADCVKPWAVPDKWIESQTPDWDPTDTFDRYVQNGRDAGQVIPNPDIYRPPVGNDPGTGFTRDSVTDGGDYGLQITLKSGNPNQAIRPGWFFPVVINPAEGPGGDNYRENIASCDPTVIEGGDVLEVEPGNMIGPTSQGVENLIAQDPDAYWDPEANDDRGGIADSCCGISPRLVAIPIFDVDAYEAARAGGRTEIRIVKVLGFFIERMQGNDVVGRLMTYPDEPKAGTEPPAGSAFVISIALVR